MTDWTDPQARKVRTKARRWAHNLVAHHHVGKSRLGRTDPLNQVGCYAEALGIHVTEAQALVRKHKAMLSEYQFFYGGAGL